MRNKKLLLTPYFLLFTLAIVACGRRGDPVAIIPYKVEIDSYREVGVVKDLKASRRDGNIHLVWGMPEGEGFTEKALKGFVIFRAEVPEGTTMEECRCSFRSLDFMVPDSKSSGVLGADSERIFEYIDKKTAKTQTYVYKLTVMDKNSSMGKDSNIVVVKAVQPKMEEVTTIPSKAPTGLNAVYTQKSIVITWEEINEQEIKFYRVYRSEGKGFFVVGETVTNAFTDEGIEPSKKYYYKVCAVGEKEGPFSREIEIVTEVY